MANEMDLEFGDAPPQIENGRRRNLPVMLVSPATMIALLEGFMRLRVPLAHQSHGETLENNFHLTGGCFAHRERKALQPYTVNSIITTMKDTVVVRDADDIRTLTDDEEVQERATRRCALFDSLVAEAVRRYATFESFVAATFHGIPNYVYMGAYFPRATTAMFFLVVPYRTAAVFPRADGQWEVQRPYIMSMRAAELEGISWHNSDIQNKTHDSYSTSGIIRGNRVATVADDHQIRLEFDDRWSSEVALRTRHITETVSYFQHTTPASGKYGDFWEERVEVGPNTWRQYATDEEKAAHDAEEARIQDTRRTSPTRRTHATLPYYMSMRCTLILLGDQTDVMRNDVFWARYVAHEANKAPRAVATPPSLSSASNDAISIVEQTRFSTLSFLARVRETLGVNI